MNEPENGLGRCARLDNSEIVLCEGAVPRCVIFRKRFDFVSCALEVAV